MADINDPLVRGSMHIDDGCDWTGYIVWDMRKNYRRSNNIHEPIPPRNQVASVKIEPKKKPRKRCFNGSKNKTKSASR